jgi:hypothetical protein
MAIKGSLKKCGSQIQNADTKTSGDSKSNITLKTRVSTLYSPDADSIIKYPSTKENRRKRSDKQCSILFSSPNIT